MVDDFTLREGSAGSWTRVTTLLTDAGQVTGALAVQHALRPAVGRDSHIARQTGAGRDVVLVPALGERTARVWQARIDGLRAPGGHGN